MSTNKDTKYEINMDDQSEREYGVIVSMNSFWSLRKRNSTQMTAKTWQQRYVLREVVLIDLV